MRTRWMAVLLALGLAWPALAQREPGPGRPERPGAQQGRGPGGGMGTPQEMAARLAETLNLTDAQQVKYDALVEKFKPKWEAQSGQREKMLELGRQMREARQSGDEARGEELRKQMDELRESSQTVMTQFLGEVEPLLTPEQVAKLNEFRDRMQRGRGGAGGGLDQLLQRLPEDLKLTDEQRAKFDELVGKYRARAQELRPLRDEMRTARQEGNTARVAELEKQIQAKGGDETVDTFVGKIEPILTDEQRNKLVDLWVRFGAGGNPDDARSVLQAAQRLELSEEQRGQLHDIARNAMQASRSEMTPEKRAELGKSVKSKIVALLDAKQSAEFERLLQSGPAGGGGRGGQRRPAGGQNQPRPETPNPAGE